MLRCIDGENGFPSNYPVERLLSIVEKGPIDAESELEEERKLFYVALTRCRKSLHVFTSSEETSLFVKELKKTGAFRRLRS